MMHALKRGAAQTCVCYSIFENTNTIRARTANKCSQNTVITLFLQFNANCMKKA